MFEGLTTLLEIQQKDREIIALREKEKGLIQSLSEKEKTLEMLEGELGKAREGETGMRVARKEREIELDSKLATIQKMETQLFQLKTNEEYQALQKEIEFLKKECTAIEDEILNMMEGLEQSGNAMAEKETAMDDVKDGIRRAKEALNAKKNTIEAEIHRLEGGKKILASSIEPLLFERYERTMRHYGNSAIVTVVDNICQGCYTNLPRHTVDEIRARREPVFCQNCSRFLYLDE